MLPLAQVFAAVQGVASRKPRRRYPVRSAPPHPLAIELDPLHDRAWAKLRESVREAYR